MARIPSGIQYLQKAKKLLSSATTGAERSQALSVILPLEGHSLEDAASKIGISKWQVCRLRREFIKDGGKKLSTKQQRGGRRRENLSYHDEIALLAPFVEEVESGNVLIIDNIKAAVEERLGRTIALASVYNLLNRHGWQRKMTSNDSETPPASPQDTKSYRRTIVRHVNVINIDSRLPNLALEKIKMYYGSRGYAVVSDPHLAGKIPTFISLLFEFNRHKVSQYEGLPGVTIAGTGYNVATRLESEIQAMKPRINVGYATRGCLRMCPWCHIAQLGAGIQVENSIYDLWDGSSRAIILLDDNILQAPSSFREVCRDVGKENLTVDFTQGLDFRLIDDEVAHYLEGIRMKDLRLALDTPGLIPQFQKTLNLLRKYKVRRDPLVYVLVGYNSSWEEDMERIHFLKSAGCRPYVQRHINVRGISKYAVMAEWCNQFWSLQKYSFEQFEKVRKERPDKKRK